MKFEIAPKETEIKANWYDAKLYCFSLRIDGKTGWRLPTKEELNEIYQPENDFEKYWYWSSTEESDRRAWCQYFGQYFDNGRQYDSKKNHGDTYVRAIRDLT
jgi:hypothetical protein